MDSLSYKTKFANSETVEKNWVVVDANGATLGRLSSEVAKILRGKNKPAFTPHVDCGDNVIVINAEGIQLSGDKMTAKQYISHSGHPGGQKIVTPEQVIEKTGRSAVNRNGASQEINGVIERAVRGMLPNTRLGRKVLRNLYVYRGENHPHEAQKPKKIEL